MAFELCLAIGCPHPRRLFDEPWSLAPADLDDWLAWWCAAPWGQRRQDLRAAALSGRLLIPHCDEGYEPPGILWPYFDNDDDDDAREEHRAFERHLERYGYK